MKGWSFLIFCLTLSFASEVLGTPSSNYTARRISYQNTGDSYNNGYQQGYGHSNSKSKSSESSESDSKSCERQECITPTNLAKIYVANGVVAYDGEYQREPEVICPCAQGSQQFFKPSMYSTAGDSDEYNQMAFYLYSDLPACQKMCIRDRNGKFWKPKDTSTYVYLVPSCMGGECNVYVGVESGSLQQDGGGDTVDSTHPIDISDVLMLPDSFYLKADAVSCGGCDEIKPHITDNCYGPGYFYNFEIDLEESKSSNEQCENSVDLPKCEIKSDKAQLFVEYGVISYDGAHQRAPQSLCHCEGGSLQFFTSVSASDSVPISAYNAVKLSAYIYNDDDYEQCQRVCLRDINGKFWEAYDEIDLGLVPYCKDGKCHTYAAVWSGVLINVETGSIRTASDPGVNAYSDAVGPDSNYLKIVALSCGGCDKIQEIDKCNVSTN